MVTRAAVVLLPCGKQESGSNPIQRKSFAGEQRKCFKSNASEMKTDRHSHSIVLGGLELMS